MTKEELLKSNLFKVFLMMVIAVSIIKIATAGYVTGQWLHSISH